MSRHSSRRPPKRDSREGASTSPPAVEESAARRQPAGPLPYITACIAGAAVMVVEVVGTRVLGPVFGVGLYVWAALLTVTLGSLAAGYYAGGAWVDNRPTIRTLGVAVTAGGGAVVWSVAMVSPLLSMTQALGPRVSPLLSATVLFSPSLVLLGMAGPMAVRLATLDVQHAGHGVGRVYALSTVGSLLSTLVVSFVLIPALETHAILLGTAAILLVNGALCFRGGKRVVVGAATLVPLALIGLLDPSGRALPDGLRIVERTQSPYGLLEVIDDGSRNVRFLRADHSVIGGRFLDRTGRIFSYLNVLEASVLARPSASRLLNIGLGTGAHAMAMQRRGLDVDVVEIDPEVVRLARDHFEFEPSGSVFVADARAFINQADRVSESPYDVIVHDTFTGGATPVHLLSLEVVQRLRKLLAPGGLLLVNFVGFDSGPHAEATWAVRRTLQSVFPSVRVFRDSPPEPDGGIRNLVFFASDDSIDLTMPRDTQHESPSTLHTWANLDKWELTGGEPDGALITDARNPLARLQLAIAEEHYEAMGKLLPLEVWRP